MLAWLRLLGLVAVALGVGLSGESDATLPLVPHALMAPGMVGVAGAAAATAGFGRLPLSFEGNQGQAGPSIRFLARGRDFTVLVGERQTALQLVSGRGSHAQTVHLTFPGASRHPRIVGLDSLPGHVNYFIGSNPRRWRTGIATFSRVVERNVYPGIDLVFHGRGTRLEYDWVVRPAANPGLIRVSLRGTGEPRIDRHGMVVIPVAGGRLAQPLPVVYQVGGRRIAARYVLRGGGQVGFSLGSYDPRRPLIIDPLLQYSTYLAGTAYESGEGIAVDGAGDAYITGTTNSTAFPVVNSMQGANRGDNDAFVTKLNPAGTAAIFSTYLGGSKEDRSHGASVDASGNVYVAGDTESPDFPTRSAVQPVYGGCPATPCHDAFITELAPDGGIVFSTHLGGPGNDGASGVALDASGNIYVAGYTSGGFPLLHPLQGTFGGAYDAWAAKLSPGGKALVYSTYLGGKGDEGAGGVAADPAGNLYLMGRTASTDFPTSHPLQPSNRGGYDGFVSKIGPDGTSLVYSTYLGGSGYDQAYGITADGSGNAYVVGVTTSSDFPASNAMQRTLKGSTDAFVTKLNPQGTAFVYSTYLGGNASDGGYGVAADGSGNAYVTGQTNSDDFPTVDPVQVARRPTTCSATGGNSRACLDAFVAKLDPSGQNLRFSSYLGGFGDDWGSAIATDGSNAYVTGATTGGSSAEFPTTYGSQLVNDGRLDTAWVAASPANESVTVGLKSLSRISAVVIDASAPPGQPADMDLKDFEVRASTAGANGSFTTVLTGTARQSGSLQTFTLPTPVDARYVQLLARDNYGNPGHVAVTELEVVGLPIGAAYHLVRPPRQTSCPTPLAQVRAIRRGLSVQPPRQRRRKGRVKMKLYQQYALRTTGGQRASMCFRDGTVLHMNQRTDLVLRNPHLTVVRQGEADEVLQPGGNHTIQTASAVATAIGTEFDIRVSKTAGQKQKKRSPQTVFIVVEGAVKVSNPRGSVIVKTDQETTVVQGKQPSPPVPVDAQAAVAWTRALPNPQLGRNLALDANGGQTTASSTWYAPYPPGINTDVFVAKIAGIA